jgi:hypothetical protein
VLSNRVQPWWRETFGAAFEPNRLRDRKSLSDRGRLLLMIRLGTHGEGVLMA